MGVITKTKSLVKWAFPSSGIVYAKLLTAYRVRRPRSMEKIFSEIYRNNAWGDSESVSGRGSTFAHTVAVRSQLPLVLRDVGARTLLDAPCGDFNWMRHTRLNEIRYIGADIVPEMIARNRQMYGSEKRTFLLLDITKDHLPKADLILCRQCLYHLSFRHIQAAIANFKKSGSTYLLATTQAIARENRDIRTGGWRFLNLHLPPFNFPTPLKSIIEYPEIGESLGLWRLEDL